MAHKLRERVLKYGSGCPLRTSSFKISSDTLVGIGLCCSTKNDGWGCVPLFSSMCYYIYEAQAFLRSENTSKQNSLKDLIPEHTVRMSDCCVSIQVLIKFINQGTACKSKFQRRKFQGDVYL